jgi:hypothetical protein
VAGEIRYTEPVLPKWLSVLRPLFATPDGPQDRFLFDITRFGIGFCPACKRLRGAASLRCLDCGSVAPVTADA